MLTPVAVKREPPLSMPALLTMATALTVTAITGNPTFGAVILGAGGLLMLAVASNPELAETLLKGWV